MDKKKLYGRWYIWEELIGYPMILFYWIKGDKIQKLLSRRIEKAKKRAGQFVLTEKKMNEFLIDYENLNNFFSYHFKKINQFGSHNFNEKIDYCLQQYKKESSNNLSSSSLMKLQGNFLAGAEETLFLHFLLYDEKKANSSFASLFSSEGNYQKFISVMRNNSYLNGNNQFDIPIIFFAGILEFLKRNGMIKKVKNIDILKLLKKDFDFEISPASYSSGTPYPTKDEEKKLFNDLSTEFMIKY
ncbi:hypothetical protein [Chryseobacterium sp. CCH4-E10]|uniref:hypothetical protein n=1 Tax=Chryseobacterium sp. CCH4-E10 TaxID=1768758 RepID=UPI000A7919DB|nr:hypothetical protein [Chryseobacterium sp. CCH4-E10]